MEIVSAVASVGSLIGGVATVATHLNNLRERYHYAPLNVTLVASSLWQVKAALDAINEWRETTKDLSKTSEQLDKDLTLSLEACACVISVIDRKLKDTDLINPSRYDKARFVGLDAIFKDFAANLDTQVRGLQLLLQVYQCRTLTERTEKLQRRDTRKVFREVEQQTASLNLEDSDLADAVSILSSEAPSVSFEVDRILLNSPLYRRVYGERYLRRAQRLSGIYVSPRYSQQDLESPSESSLKRTRSRSTASNSGTYMSHGPDGLPFLGIPFAGEKVEEEADAASESASVKNLDTRTIDDKDSSGTQGGVVLNEEKSPSGSPFSHRKFSFSQEQALGKIEEEALIDSNLASVSAKSTGLSTKKSDIEEETPSGAKNVTTEQSQAHNVTNNDLGPKPKESATPGSPGSAISHLYSEASENEVEPEQNLQVQVTIEDDENHMEPLSPQSSGSSLANSEDAGKTTEMLEDEIHSMLKQVSSHIQSELIDDKTPSIQQQEEITPDSSLSPSHVEAPMITKASDETRDLDDDGGAKLDNFSKNPLEIDFGGDLNLDITSLSSRKGSIQDSTQGFSQESTQEPFQESTPDSIQESGDSTNKVAELTKSNNLVPEPLISAFRDRVYGKRREPSPYGETRISTPTLASSSIPASPVIVEPINVKDNWESPVIEEPSTVKDNSKSSSRASSELLSPEVPSRNTSEALDSIPGPGSSPSSVLKIVDSSSSLISIKRSNTQTNQRPSSLLPISSFNPRRSSMSAVRPQIEPFTQQDAPPPVPKQAPPPIPTQLVEPDTLDQQTPPKQPDESVNVIDTRKRAESEGVQPVTSAEQRSPVVSQMISNQDRTRSAPPNSKMPPPPLPSRPPPPIPIHTSTPPIPAKSPPPVPPKIPSPGGSMSPPITSSLSLPAIPLQSPNSPQAEKIPITQESQNPPNKVRELRSNTATSASSLHRPSAETLSTSGSRTNTSSLLANDAESILSASTTYTSRSSYDGRSADSPSYRTNLTAPSTFESIGVDSRHENRQRDKDSISNALKTHFRTGSDNIASDKKPLRKRISTMFGSERHARIKALNEASATGDIPTVESCIRDLTMKDIQTSIILTENSFQDSFPKTPLMRAAAAGQIEVLDRLVKAGSDFPQTDRNGRIALHYAIMAGEAEATQWMAERFRLVATPGYPLPPGPLEITDGEGQGSLAIAAYTGRVDIMNILIKCGAKLEGGDRMHRTPIFSAIRSNKFTAVRCLLASGANANHQDAQKETPLMCAARLGLEEIVGLLLDHKVNRFAQDQNGDYALHHAARNGHLGTIERLYLSLEDLEVKNNLGERPLHVAAEANRHVVVKALLQAGTNPNAFTTPPIRHTKNTKKGSIPLASAPLHYACRGGYFDVAEDLIAKGALVNSNLEDGTSPLMMACEAQDLPTVALLLRNGANVNAQTSTDRVTALHKAVAKPGSLDIVKELLDYGADPRLKTKKNETALAYGANNSGDSEVASHLARHESQIMRLHRNPIQARVRGTYPEVPSVPSHTFANPTQPHGFPYPPYAPGMPAYGPYGGLVPYGNANNPYAGMQMPPPQPSHANGSYGGVADGGVRLDPAAGWYNPEQDSTPDVAPPAYDTVPRRNSRNGARGNS